MEPKDLKNSEELKSTQKPESNKTENPASKDGKTQKKEPQEQDQVSVDENVRSENATEAVKAEPENNAGKKEKGDDEELKASEKADVKKEAEPVKSVSDEPGDNAHELQEKEDVTSMDKAKTKPDSETEKKADSKETIQEPESKSTEEETGSSENNEKAEEVDETVNKVPEQENVAEEEVASAETGTEVDKTENVEKPESENEKAPASETKKVKPAAESQEKKEKPDYTKFSQVELVNALRDVLDSDRDEFEIKDEVDVIRSVFYKQHKEEIEKQREEFLANGGNEEDFEPADNPYEQDIKELLKKFRQVRIEINKKLDSEKEENLKIKYEIIEEIKGLINKEESINKTFNDFRDLQQKWRETGLVPQSKMKDLWENYHFHVENFYDYIKINKELRDLDLKKNLEMKIRLCEQAEELLLEPNVVKAFNSLQKLHERWREIGPVPRENKDDLWERFKSSTAKINKKHQEYFESRKSDQKKNLEAKKALCEQVEEINEQDLANHKDWDEKSKEVVELQKVWRTIGFAPRKDNNKIYDRFRKACDSFFDAKRDFYSKNKELQQNNLQMKIDLCLQAESLKDSDDWKKTTQDFINIQKQWKEIGPVPRKQSDALWKRFRAACDFFFDKKSSHFSNVDSEQADNLKEKEKLVEEVENFKTTGDVNENLRLLKDIQRRWTEIGHVPIKKKDEIQKKFREAINKLYDELNLDESKRNMLRFKSKMSSFSESSRGQNKMRLERDKYMTKLKQLENDLVLLDNNIGFFAKSKNAESLIEDVNRKIEQTREKIEFLKNKIRVIDEMDSSEE